MKLSNDFPRHIEQMLKAQTEAEEIASALNLADHYQDLLETHAALSDFTNKEETFLDGGVALASQFALDCLRDLLRTARFIKGTFQAIKDQLENKTQVNLLYAGCGPAAPLVLPLLHKFSAQELRINLLDVTPSSIKAVRNLIESLGLHHYIENYLVTDAITYKGPEQSIDIIVSETMDKGLTREPQVRIMQNLMPLLKKDGAFIPQCIDLFAGLSFYGKEPYFDLYKDLSNLGESYPEGKLDQKLFSITNTLSNAEPFEFISEKIEIPRDISLTPDAVVYANIKIYKDQVLTQSKSLISNPYCIRSLTGLEGQHFKLRYSTLGTPDWELLIE
ncbi:hypothetical protein [Gilvibacter sp.]|uniref:hypothetical protein n=1 Tax=Gilvibacter sp. TaxID=2729997 RepID=UPI003F49F6F8